MESETEPRELSAEFVFAVPVSSMLGFLSPFLSYMKALYRIFFFALLQIILIRKKKIEYTIFIHYVKVYLKII